ncbi:MAG: glutamate--cysteine ligase, partial [Eubacteriaceae bacterium]|nr:glutamate--cysteine ligase [Eubacteriaceae bacterium]
MEYYIINKAAIAEYIRKGEKKGQCVSVGLEFEHIITDKNTMKSVSYYGEKGVESILKELENKGWRLQYSGDYVIGADRNGDNISLEPGSQFELSIDKTSDINKVAEKYLSFVSDVVSILEKNDQNLMAVGYHPVTCIDEIKFLPKERYQYMSEYLLQRGSHAHNMMKGSASTQTVIDYTDEEDFIKKFRVANSLTVILSLICDNSPVFEGKIWPGNLARVNIWNHMDDDRSRVVPGALDTIFSYDDYAQYILNAPAIVSLIDDKFEYTKERLIKDIYRDRKMTEKEIEHVLTMFFPDVRVKKYIELRMCDSLPYPYNVALGALVKGIFYHEENLDYYYKRSKSWTDRDIQEMKDMLIENAEIPSQIIDDMKELVCKAEEGLGAREKKFIKPLSRLLEESLNLSLKIKSEISAEGYDAAKPGTGNFDAFNIDNMNLILKEEIKP